MNVQIVESPAKLDTVGADFVAALIGSKPSATVLVATGQTPMGLYAELGARYRRGEIDPRSIRAIQLDEYFGLSEDDPRSLYGWMKRSFVDPLGLDPDQLVRLSGDELDPETICRRYDEAVRDAGGIDLSILGLGPNGHLGFNEPPSDADAPTRLVSLSEESIRSNGTYWGGQDRVPRQALTAGMNVLLRARNTLLVVSGAHKREILRRTVHGPVTSEVPASYLQDAANVTVLADRDAWPEDVTFN